MEAVLQQVEAAVSFEDLFGPLPPREDAAMRVIAARFRELSRHVHPDAARDAGRRAHEAFVKLTRLRCEAERSFRKDAEPEAIVVTKKAIYRVGAIAHAGDVCDLHRCTFDTGGGLFKMARSEADDDLVEAEARTLARLRPSDARDEKFFRYLPILIDAFRARIAGSARRVNVLAAHDCLVSLEEVRAVHRNGLDFRDVAWIWKRMLVGVGYVHRQGLVHGAVLPPHVLVHPVQHGARLIDWCYSVEIGAKVRVRAKSWSGLYAPEIAAREPATPVTDIFMIASTVKWLLDDRAPQPILTFLATCMAPSPRRRPDDAWALHEELEVLLRRLVGPPAYRELRI